LTRIQKPAYLAAGKQQVTHMRNLLLITALTTAVSMNIHAQSNPPAQAKIAAPDPHIYFEENKNQWPAQVMFKADLPGGVVYLEKNKLTFGTHSLADLDRIHEMEHDAKTNADWENARNAKVKCHAWYVHFDGGNPQTTAQGERRETALSNYFIGNDPQRWASNVQRFGGVLYNGLYDGIDLRTYSAGGWFKYDFIVAQGADVKQIKLRYEGVTPVLQKDGSLLLNPQTGNVVEQKPVAWQIDNGKKIPVRCVYKLKGNVLSFEFPDGYNENLQLIIDPVLVGATYSGSTATTYGHSATFDNQGNIYSGGRCFGQGYPATPGAYDLIFGGYVDIAISKYDQTASTLFWATYVGGTSDEYVHSMFVHTNGNLYIFGSVNSTDYPVTAGCFDGTHNGSSDILVTELNPTGSALVGSTFVGGGGSDGLDMMALGYQQRGEIIVDGAGNAAVASVSSSANFPTTPGSVQPVLGGQQDAVVFSLNPGLTSMNFCTYFGGTNNDSGQGVRVSANSGEVYFCGSTASGATFPASPWAYQSVSPGGNSDGYVAHLDPAGSMLAAATFFGTTGDDQCFFLDLDSGDDVYIYGTAPGGTGAPITAGVYSNPNSPMFVAKLDPFFVGLIYSTQIGSGSLFGTLSPTAFMVDICENVYIAGFGGNNYPTTSNALYTAANAPGSCYLAVLAKDALALNYGTLYGGYHVDGGTSRFDPQGIVYHGVCQGGAGFPTTPGAYNAGPGPGWDICPFKIDFQQVGVIAQAVASPSDTGCVPYTVSFTNNSVGVDYLWDFGDGSPTTTVVAPTHTYTVTGTFTVTLIASDSTSCVTHDTLQFTITVLAAPVVDLGLDSTFCSTVSGYTLDAGNPGLTYIWSTGATSQTISPTAAGTYWVIADNGSCSDTDSVVVQLVQPPPPLVNDSLCVGQTHTLTVSTGQAWLWNTGATTQSITVNTTGDYDVTITDGPCVFHDTVHVHFFPYPIVDLGNDTIMCTPDNLLLDADNPGATYLWQDGSAAQTFNATNAGSYHVMVTANNCASLDTIAIAYTPQPELGSAITLCEVLDVTLNPGTFPPTATFLWNTGEVTPTIQISQPDTYRVVIQNGPCTLTDSILVTGMPGEGALYIPNTFTPNRDGKNEQLLAMGTGITEFRMRVFNRWGQLLYTSNDIYDGWNGQYNNNLVQEDTYVIIIDYRTTCNNNRLERRVTHVNVLR
jgi:gliding motility-associated-like protein